MVAADVIPWWGWVLLWAVLVLGALALAVVAAWRLFRSATAVVTEAAGAAARAGELLSQVERLPRAPTPGPAVLEDPAALRRARLAEMRRRRKVRAVAVQARRERVRTPVGTPVGPAGPTGARADGTGAAPAPAHRATGRAYDRRT